MKFIRSIFFVLSLIAVIALVANAQVPIANSIIVKLKHSASLLTPSENLRTVCARVSMISIDRAERIRPKGPTNNLQSIVDSIGLDRVITLPLRNGISVEDAAKLFTTIPEVEYAEPNHIFHIDRTSAPNDSLYTQQWAHSAMDVLGAWQYTRGDSAVRIGFVDTGVQWDHPDLVGQFAVNSTEDINHNGLFDAWPSTEKRTDAHGHLVFGDLDGIDEDGNGYVDDVIGYDFVDEASINFGDASVRDPIPYDEESHTHGTAVAGVIAAASNNRIGVAGIAPGCRLVALRALDALGNGESDDIATAIVYAADNGVRILNLSFGDYFPSLLMRDAIRYATSKGVLVVASSGNEGSDSRHYPSDFSDCLSVGMTTLDNLGNEVLSPASSFGEGMDIIAPGTQILTTGDNGGYQFISGTSFSSPATAAVAGLLLSRYADLTNSQLRSILESTTDRLSAQGYDHTHANGRVNAKRALEFVGRADIGITSPTTDDELVSDSNYVISGSSITPLFKYYTLSFAPGLNPDRDPNNLPTWQVIDSSTHQVIADVLANWNTSSLANGTYTLRLAVETSDLRSVEERTTIRIRNRQAFGATVIVDSMYSNEKRVLLIYGRSDSLTRAFLYFKPRTSDKWFEKHDEVYGHSHSIILSNNEVVPNIALDLRMVYRTNSGDSISFSFTSVLDGQQIAQTGFAMKPYALPSGYLLDTVLTTKGKQYLIQNIASSASSFGSLGAFTFDKATNQFVIADSLNLQGLPRSIGNVMGTTAPQLLVQGSGGNTYIYQANAAHPIFGDLIFADTNSALPFFATSFADVDGDGIDKLIGRQEISLGSTLQDRYEADKITNGERVSFGVFSDSTPPAPHYGVNTFSTPDTKAADFSGSGIKQVAFIDDDADIVISQYTSSNPGNFTPYFVDLNQGYTEGRNFAVGDFDGDGRQDVAIAYHTQYDLNDDLELDPSFWTVKVLLNQGGGTFRTAYLDHFYLARSNSPYRSSLGSIHNVNGGTSDELVLSLFPNFYLLQYDATLHSMRPIWQYPISNSPRGALAYDFDGNGIPEFGFDTGDSIHFFERSPDFLSRAPSVAGLEAIPRDSNQIDLRWSLQQAATKYFILRANDIPNAAYAIIDSTSNLNYSDRTVENFTHYIYSIQSFVNSYQSPFSSPAPGVLAYAHPIPQFEIISTSPKAIQLKTTQPVASTGLSGGEFVYDSFNLFSSAIINGDNSILLTPLVAEISPGLHSLQLRSQALRDIWNSPFDTSLSLSWNESPIVIAKRFFITNWTFISGSTISVTFSMRPDDNSLTPSKYTLSPFGTIANIRRDPSSDSSLIISLLNSQSLRAIGTSYTLCVDAITSNGIPIESEGNCAGETPVSATLDHLFTYPSPVRESDETMTFAGLTPRASITIYTPAMKLLKRLESSVQTGGISWDLRDEAGNKLPSGVYLYRVSGISADGQNVESAESKFVIVRDR